MVFLARAIVGEVRVGKEAQVSLRGLRWKSAICAWMMPTKVAWARLTVRARID